MGAPRAKVVAVYFGNHRSGVEQPEMVVVRKASGKCEDYAVDFCRRDQTYYYDDIGNTFGVPSAPHAGRYWLASEFAGDGERLSDMPAALTIWPPVGWMEGHLEWCDVCHDWLPEEKPCPHFLWCRVCGWYYPPEPVGPVSPFAELCEHLVMQRGQALSRLASVVSDLVGVAALVAR